MQYTFSEGFRTIQKLKGPTLALLYSIGKKRLIKFNMTSLFLLCADWASAVAILRSLRIVILSLCFSSKIILVHPVLSNRPPGFVKDVYYPHFFLSLAMTCIDFDIQQSVSSYVTNNRIPRGDFDMIFYADDTVLFSRSNRGLNELLRLTEHVSKGYGLGLNKGKCVAIAMNNNGSIHFDDGIPLTKEFEATYLGNEIFKSRSSTKCRKCDAHGTSSSRTGKHPERVKNGNSHYLWRHNS